MKVKIASSEDNTFFDNASQHDMTSLRLGEPTIIGHLLYMTFWTSKDIYQIFPRFSIINH